MEFSIASTNDRDLRQVVLTDPASRTQVAILPDYGAMLHGFSVEQDGRLFNVIDNYSDAAAIREYLSTSFKSSKLSPFVCRIPGGKYFYDGQEFELQHKFKDGSAIHGLLYNKSFKQTDSFFDEQKASVVFKYHYKEEDDGYPFSYTCEIRYTLFPRNTLQLETTITNLDDLPIPIADGWHPYFTVGGKLDQWLLQFGSTALVEFGDNLVPTGRLLPYDIYHEATLIGNTSFDNCFMVEPSEGAAACTIRNEATGLQVSIFPGITYPYLQIFTPPHRNSMAIENLSAAPDAFNNKMGLLMLQPRHTHTFTVYYQVS